MKSLRTWVFVVTIFVLICILYAYNLDKVPVHFNQDELGFSLNASSLAKTGFDENNRYLPFYFWHLGLMWSTPIVVYLPALILKFAPLSESTVRLSSVFVGVIDVLLLYSVLKKRYADIKYAIIGAVLFSLIPAHFIHSRLLLDNLYPVPFVLGWILALIYFKEKKSPKYLFLCALLLGIGIHSYHAAKILMPIYLLFTFVITLPEIKNKKSLIIVLLIGFFLPILPLVVWLQKYPDTLTDQVKYVGLYDTSLTPLQGLLTLLKPEIIMNRLLIYFSYFNFDFLFFTGDSSLIHSTRETGVFLFSFLLLLPLGIERAIKKKDWFSLLTVAGFFSAPVAAAFVGNQYRVSKELVILPFAALLATEGIYVLLCKKDKVKNIMAYVTIAFTLVQFSYFLNDYYVNYPKRAYSWFNYNIPGALEAVIQQQSRVQSKAIYLDGQVWFIDRYWRFYTLKKGKEEYLPITSYHNISSIDYDSIAPGSLLLVRFDHFDNNSFSSLTPLQIITEPDGMQSYYLFKK